jgi:hypothetical protein
MDRTDDFGCVAILAPSGVRLAGFHRLLVDPRGQFTGIELAPAFREFEGLAREERTAMEEALDATARALRQAGYSGPFGIDAWRYRGSGGEPAFHPLGEINARMTFGLIARALVDRLREPLGLAPGDRLRLVLGRQPPGEPSLPLLLPEGDGGGAAWLVFPSI